MRPVADRPSLTLRRAVVVPAAVGTFTLALITGAAVAFIFWQQSMTQLERDMTNALTSVREAASGAAWTVDSPAAALIVQGLMTDPRVSRAGFAADSFPPLERGIPVAGAKRFEQRLVHGTGGSQQDVGSIFVETDPSRIGTELFDTAIGIGLLMTVLVSTASLWVIWLLHARVARPIQALARHAHDLATKPLKDVTAPDWYEVCVVDEIRALGKILDELRLGNLTTLGELADRRLAELEAQTSKLDALARMSGGVAHEFNNLLQPIRTLSEMGSGSAGTDPAAAERARTYFATINATANQASAIAADFLTFCGAAKRPLRSADLGAAVRAAAAQIRPLLAEGCELRLDLAPGLVAPFDELGLVQVLGNLLKNASEALAATTDRVREVTISVTRRAGGEVIELRVADNGPGMTEAVRARVFEPFFTTKGVKGTGLGLSVVYGIVTAWGGTIDVETRLGAGSSFVIRLPVAQLSFSPATT